MNISGILQTIGTIASVLGLTYAFYVTKNNQKQNIVRAKEKINKKILFLIGYDNEIDSVEILSIINSILRQYKIDKNKVLPSEIIEDFISIIICNPLLTSDRKNEINNRLKKVLNEFIFAQGILNINDKQEKIVFESDIKDTENAKAFIKNNIQKTSKYEESKKKSRFYDIIIIIIFTFVLIFFLSVVLFFPDSNNDYININWVIVFISLLWIVLIIYDIIRKRKNK